MKCEKCGTELIIVGGTEKKYKHRPGDELLLKAAAIKERQQSIREPDKERTVWYFCQGCGVKFDKRTFIYNPTSRAAPRKRIKK